MKGFGGFIHLSVFEFTLTSCIFKEIIDPLLAIFQFFFFFYHERIKMFLLSKTFEETSIAINGGRSDHES